MSGGDATSSLMKVGPATRVPRGRAWEMKDTKISQMLIAFEDGVICGLQFQLVKDGKLVFSEVFGKLAARNCEMVSFDPVNEYITGIRGCLDFDGVSTIAIETNAKTHGPFGRPNKRIPGFRSPWVTDKDYEYSFRFGPGNHFGGFYGTFTFFYNSNNTEKVELTSIGVYVIPYSNLEAINATSK